LFLVLANAIAEVFLGRQGIDFAIFSQITDSLSRRGSLLSSLIGSEWRHFLTHHFSPIFYAPGVLGYLGIPAYIALPIFHVFSLALAAWAVYLTASLRLSRLASLVAVFLLFANPTCRHALLFGVHDELFALPFIGFAFFFFLSGRHVPAILSILGATLAKESLFPLASMFGVMALVDQSLPQRPKRLYLVLVVTTFFAFIAYVFLQPWLLDKPFDHVNKLATLSDLLRVDYMIQKSYLLVFLLLPVLAYPLWKRRHWHLILPALPMIALIMASRFDEMWKPMNYYGVVPSYVIFVAAVVVYGRQLGRSKLSAYGLALLVALSFSWSSKKPIKTLIALSQNSLLYPEQLSFIGEDARVIASPAAALFLFRTKFLWNLDAASESLPETFDYIVSLESEEAKLSPALKHRSNLCREVGLWKIRCAH
jgi:hypothetical protein